MAFDTGPLKQALTIKPIGRSRCCRGLFFLAFHLSAIMKSFSVNALITRRFSLPLSCTRKRSPSPNENRFLRQSEQCVHSKLPLEEQSNSFSYWERLGKPRTAMAPMVAQSDLPFRHLCRNSSGQRILCFTQMIHSQNFISSKAFQDSYLDVYKSNNSERILLSKSAWSALEGLNWCTVKGQSYSLKRQYNNLRDRNNWEIYSENGPLIVQLAGNNPEVMSKAATSILERTNIESESGIYKGSVCGIDVNLGCPQRIAKKGRYGAFLIEESIDTVSDILSRMRRDLPSNISLSAKIRIPDGDSDLKERICKLIDAGVELITVHGRTLKENKTMVRECNWDAIALAVRTAREYSGNHDFPVIANGGIEFSSDIQKCIDVTGASAVMSSEALLENPGIFNPHALDDIEMEAFELFKRQIQFCHSYLDLCIQYPPLPGSLGKVGGSFNCIRGHLFKILYRYLEENADLRELLGNPKQTTSIQNARDLVQELEKRYSAKDRSGWTDALSSKKNASWYRRHRNANAKVRRRGEKISQQFEDQLNMVDRKIAIKERIDNMKEQRLRKNKIIIQ